MNMRPLRPERSALARLSYAPWNRPGRSIVKGLFYRAGAGGQRRLGAGGQGPAAWLLRRAAREQERAEQVRAGVPG